MKMSKFTCAVIAGAIAITSAATIPAYAVERGDKLAKILLGAAAVGLIAHTVHKNKKSRATVTQYDHYDAYRPNKPRVRHNNHRPRTCLRKKYTNHGWKTFYSRRCLEKHRVRHNDVYSDGHGHNHAHGNKHHHYNKKKRHNNEHRYNQKVWNDNHGRKHRHKYDEKK